LAELANNPTKLGATVAAEITGRPEPKFVARDPYRDLDPDETPVDFYDPIQERDEE
jgi:hypothetical protein